MPLFLNRGDCPQLEYNTYLKVAAGQGNSALHLPRIFRTRKDRRECCSGRGPGEDSPPPLPAQGEAAEPRGSHSLWRLSYGTRQQGTWELYLSAPLGQHSLPRKLFLLFHWFLHISWCFCFPVHGSGRFQAFCLCFFTHCGRLHNTLWAHLRYNPSYSYVLPLFFFFLFLLFLFSLPFGDRVCLYSPDCHSVDTSNS